MHGYSSIEQSTADIPKKEVYGLYVGHMALARYPTSSKPTKLPEKV